MSQEDKYTFFNVGLLKGSFALETFHQDALKYHMIDSPGQLIALRLTEYYELLARGMVPSVTNHALSAPPSPLHNGGGREERNFAGLSDDTGTSTLTSQMNDGQPNGDSALVTSPAADQNAEDAADYWALL
jgi:hypothetical protein